MRNPMELAGRVFVVTGASSGIGRATAILLSQLGGRVVLVARTESRLIETLTLMDGAGHKVAPLDLRRVDELCKWMKDIVAEVGPLSGVVHSAGIEGVRPLRFLTSAALDEVMQINFVVGVHLAKAFRQRGVCGPSGSLVYLSSVAGVVGQAGHIAYCASKGAIGGFVRAAAVELAAEGIRVNCVAPGWVAGTGMTISADHDRTAEQMEAIKAQHPLGICIPEDVANAIAFLLADTGRRITGTTLMVDGGYTAQ